MTELVPDRLWALSNPFELDGRVTTHPLDVRGFAPMQCYLLKEGDRALLIGSGWTVHQDALLEQLTAALGDARLSLLPMRLEFPSLCNARPIADRFPIDAVYERVPLAHPDEWLNFRPEFPITPSSLRRATPISTSTGDLLPIDADGRRTLRMIEAPLRLVPTHWGYDEETRTLFTVDMFSWVYRPTSAGPWVADADDDTTADTVHHHLARNRYWWLPGANTDSIRRALADVFERYEVETIAPEWGCVLRGADAVRRHYDLLDGVLRDACDEAPTGIDPANWRFAGAAR